MTLQEVCVCERYESAVNNALLFLEESESSFVVKICGVYSRRSQRARI